MAIQKNATVKAIGGFYDGRVGKVCSIFPEIDTAVVSFDDNGDVGKVSLSALVEIQSQESKIVGVKVEIPEGAKKISRADFDAAVEKITSPEKMMDFASNPMVGLIKILTAKIVDDSVRDKIFKDQDVVVMTEDEVILALWDACNPIAVNEMTTGGKTSNRKAVKVAITALISLEEIVDILFGAENG